MVAVLTTASLNQLTVQFPQRVLYFLLWILVSTFILLYGYFVKWNDYLCNVHIVGDF